VIVLTPLFPFSGPELQQKLEIFDNGWSTNMREVGLGRRILWTDRAGPCSDEPVRVSPFRDDRSARTAGRTIDLPRSELPPRHRGTQNIFGLPVLTKGLARYHGRLAARTTFRLSQYDCRDAVARSPTKLSWPKSHQFTGLSNLSVWVWHNIIRLCLRTNVTATHVYIDIYMHISHFRIAFTHTRTGIAILHTHIWFTWHHDNLAWSTIRTQISYHSNGSTPDEISLIATLPHITRSVFTRSSYNARSPITYW